MVVRRRKQRAEPLRAAPAGSLRFGREWCIRERVCYRGWVAVARTAFEKEIVQTFPSYLSLARRLEDGTLTSAESAALTRTRFLVEKRREGWKMAHIAEALHVSPKSLAAFVGTGQFRVMARWMQEKAKAPDDVAKIERARDERERLELMGPKALDYLESCFDRDKDGKYVSRQDAKFATTFLGKSKGWDEPEGGKRQIDVKVGVIQKQQRAIAESDKAFHGAVVVEAEGQRVMVALPEPAPSVSIEGEFEDAEHEESA